MGASAVAAATPADIMRFHVIVTGVKSISYPIGATAGAGAAASGDGAAGEDGAATASMPGRVGHSHGGGPSTNPMAILADPVSHDSMTAETYMVASCSCYNYSLCAPAVLIQLVAAAVLIQLIALVVSVVVFRILAAR